MKLARATSTVGNQPCSKSNGSSAHKLLFPTSTLHKLSHRTLTAGNRLTDLPCGRDHRHLPAVACKASKQPPSSATDDSGNDQLVSSLGIAALWVGLIAYVALLGPNQTPFRDSIFIQRILGVGEQDGFVVNPVFVALFNMMGVYPGLYACLLVPAARSDNKVPAWPFVTLSFLAGAFALLPYMALWRPIKGLTLPPPKEELEGWNRLWMKGAETPFIPLGLLAGAVFYWGMALSSPGEVWSDYLKLFDESRLVHTTSLDFAVLTTLLPFWMYNDAQARQWEPRDKVLPVLCLLPLVGPALYLVLRPKTQQ